MSEAFEPNMDDTGVRCDVIRENISRMIEGYGDHVVWLTILEKMIAEIVDTSVAVSPEQDETLKDHFWSGPYRRG